MSFFLISLAIIIRCGNIVNTSAHVERCSKALLSGYPEIVLLFRSWQDKIICVAHVNNKTVQRAKHEKISLFQWQTKGEERKVGLQMLHVISKWVSGQFSEGLFQISGA